VAGRASAGLDALARAVPALSLRLVPLRPVIHAPQGHQDVSLRRVDHVAGLCTRVAAWSGTYSCVSFGGRW
jgi:hypothetical protein